MLRISVFSLMMLLFSPGCNNQPFTPGGGLTHTSSSPYVKLKSVNIGDVKWTEGFWAEKFDLVLNTTIPFMKTIYMDRALLNFKIAAGMEEGEF